MNRIASIALGIAIALGSVALVSTGGRAQAADNSELVWSVHVDITGPASFSGAKQAEGFEDYVAWKNANGGIRGHKIKLLMSDTTFKPAVAVASFKKVLSEYKPVFVSGDGTAMVKALNAENNSTYHILMTSGSFGTEMDDTATYPLHFMAGPTYGDQIEILLKYIKQAHKGSARPKLAVVHSNIAFGRDPVERVEQVAKKLGIDITLVQQTKFNEADVGPFALAVRQANPDYVVFHGYAYSVWPEIMRQVKDYGLKTNFLGTIWSMDRIKVKEVGAYAEGYMGVMPFNYNTRNTPGAMMKIIDEIQSKKNPKYNGYAETGYYQSWMHAMMATKAIEIVMEQGKPMTGENLADALRSVKKWDTGGMYGIPVNVTGQKIGVGRIYKWEAGNDWNPIPVSDWITVD